jgi:YVTN family beta-propeller protein
MKTKCPLPKGFSGTRWVFGILVGLLALSMTAAPAAIGAPFAYVSNSGSTNVSVVDGAKVGIPGAVAVTNVTVDPSMPFNLPWGVAVNATNTLAYVTNYGDSSVSVINTATNRVVAKVRVGYLPIGIAVNAAGTRAYTANSGDGSVSVIDTATLSVVATIPAVGEFLYGIAINPAGTYVYVTDWAFSSRTGLVQVIDAGSNTLFKSVSVGSFPVGVGVSP